MGLEIAKAALATGHKVVATGRNTEKVSRAIGASDSCHYERTENRIWIRLARIGRSGAIEGRPKSAKSAALAIQAGQRVIHDLLDLAQRMSGRDPRLKVHIPEQRSARQVNTAHDHHRRYRAEGESFSQILVEAGLIQHPVKS